MTVPLLSTSDHNGLLTTLKWKATAWPPAGIPSGGMLMLIGRKHVSLLTTLTGTHNLLMVSVCPGLTGNNNYFYEHNRGVQGFSPKQNLLWLNKNLINAREQESATQRQSKLKISLNISLHTTVLYQIQFYEGKRSMYYTLATAMRRNNGGRCVCEQNQRIEWKVIIAR